MLALIFQTLRTHFPDVEPCARVYTYSTRYSMEYLGFMLYPPPRRNILFLGKHSVSEIKK